MTRALLRITLVVVLLFTGHETRATGHAFPQQNQNFPAGGGVTQNCSQPTRGTQNLPAGSATAPKQNFKNCGAAAVIGLPTHVQDCPTIGFAGASTTCTMPGNVTSGNMLVVGLWDAAASTTFTVSGSGGCGGTWTAVGANATPDATAIVNIFTSKAISTAACVITCGDTTPAFLNCEGSEYGNWLGTVTADGAMQSSAQAAATNSPVSLSAGASNEVLIGFSVTGTANSNASSVAAPFTVRANPANGQFVDADDINDTVGAHTCTITMSNSGRVETWGVALKQGG